MKIIILAMEHGVTLHITPNEYEGFTIRGSKGPFHFSRMISFEEMKVRELTEMRVYYEIQKWINDIETKGTVTDYVGT